MISAGVFLLLFVVYQLWGTGVRTDAAQTSLRDDFQARKAEMARDAPAATATPTTVAPTTGPKPLPTTTVPVAPSTAAPTPPPKSGDAIGVIRIPRIDVD